jgi:hypothetical protein
LAAHPRPDAPCAIEAGKAAVTAQLAAHGIAQVTIVFDGFGGEAQIESAMALEVAGGERPLQNTACARHGSGFGGGVSETDGTPFQALVSLGYEVLASTSPRAPASWRGHLHARHRSGD